ncbi:MAG: hypothetical protein WA941_03310 [Nitrososphaeraceae archaeon]
MHSHDNERGHYSYLANRITVRNVGKSAANDCKAYIGKESPLIPTKSKTSDTTKNLPSYHWVSSSVVTN